MLNIKLTDKAPSVETTISTLVDSNKILGIPLDYDRIVEYVTLYGIKSGRLMQAVSKLLGVKDPTDAVVNSWLDSLNAYTGFDATEKGARSLSGDSIRKAIATGLYDKRVCKVLDAYSKAKDYRNKVSDLKGIMENNLPCKFETYDGHRMILVKPIWRAQNTGRVAMSDPAIQNIARELQDVITVPKGFTLVHVDSGQIEPRVIYSAYIDDPQIKALINLYNDAYYGILHYVSVLTDEEIMSGTLDFKPFEINDEKKALRQRLKTYGNAVMYGSTENNEKDPLKDAYIKRIGGHPKRVRWASDIERRVNMGERIFTTKFGTPIDITSGPSDAKYDKNSNAYIKHLIRCAINNPIQGTAADLMRMSVAAAYRVITRSAPNSCILQYVHDAGYFMVHNSDVPQVLDILKDITAYQVDDWIPIYGDAVIGHHNTSGIKRFI